MGLGLEERTRRRGGEERRRRRGEEERTRRRGEEERRRRRRALADGHVICELVISPCCIKPVFSWMCAMELQAAFIPARLWDLVSCEKGENQSYFNAATEC